MIKKTPNPLPPPTREELEELAAQLPPSPFAAELELGRLVTEAPSWALEQTDIAATLVSEPGRVRMALTGGIACGKSTVAEIFVELGAIHIDFDQLARLAVAPGSQGLVAAAELFGPKALDADGTLNRPYVRQAIFNDPQLKEVLENIIHPITWQLMGTQIDQNPDAPLTIISIPLLFEAGLETFFNPITTIFAPISTQIARLAQRHPNSTEDDLQNMIDAQWPAPPKIMGSSFVIHNAADLSTTRTQVEHVWQQLTGRPV